MLSPDGCPVQVEEGFSVTATGSYADADVSKPKYIVIPGGECESVMDCESLDRLLKAAVDQSGTVVSGICNGALVLANAEVLDGRKCTHTAVPEHAPLPQFQELLDFATPKFARSTYIDEDVVTDGNIMTAKPWAFTSFAVKLAELGDEVKSEAKQEMINNLRGT